MSTLKIETTITKTDTNSGALTFSVANSTSYTSLEDVEYSIGASTEKIIWDPTSDGAEGTSDFDRLVIISSGSCELELECDTGAEVGREMIVVTLIANVPFILGSDASRANITTFDGFAGTLDVIDKITAKSGASAITLRKIIST